MKYGPKPAMRRPELITGFVFAFQVICCLCPCRAIRSGGTAELRAWTPKGRDGNVEQMFYIKHLKAVLVFFFVLRQLLLLQLLKIFQTSTGVTGQDFLVQSHPHLPLHTKGFCRQHLPCPWTWACSGGAGGSRAHLSVFAGIVGSMDTMQLSAVKREMVVFLKSKFQGGLFDLGMLAGILCCCMWCRATFSPAKASSPLTPSLAPLLPQSRRSQSSGQGRLDASPM